MDREGHRKRLFDRYEKSGLQGFANYEILEIILTYSIPRKDTKSLAKRLLKRFGSVGNILNADINELESVGGIGRRTATLLSLINSTFEYRLMEQCSQKKVIKSKYDVSDLLRVKIGLDRRESIYAIFLDTGNNIISFDCVAKGSVGKCSIFIREIVLKALEYKSASLILSHNHPGGARVASDSDWDVTRKMIEALKVLDMELLDHIIVTANSVVSLRESSNWPN